LYGALIITSSGLYLIILYDFVAVVKRKKEKPRVGARGFVLRGIGGWNNVSLGYREFF
jgi:hypothetical protein